MNITSVKFHDQEIQVLSHEGKPYVAMRSVAENIGLDWASQYRRIKNNKVLNGSVVIMTTQNRANFEREVICLPLGYLNGWLLGIDINRVKPEIRETLYLYQLECYDVLYNHFLPEVAKEHPNTITAEQQYEIKSLVNEASRKTGIHYQGIYTRMYDRFKVPRYQEIKVSDYPKVIEFLAELVGYEVFKDEKKESQIFAVALMKLGLRRYLEAREAYSQIENEMHKASDTLRSLGRTLREVGQQSGIIYDGLAEAQHYLNLDKDVYEEAHAKAMSMRERLVLEEQ